MDEFLHLTKKASLDRQLMAEKAYDIIISNLFINDSKETPLGEFNAFESSMTKTFVPGNIYIFGYKADTKIQVSLDDIHTFEFYDKMPLILCTSNQKNYISGINLNMCPCNVKTCILNEIWNLDPAFYSSPTKTSEFSENTLRFFANPANVKKFKEYVISKYKLEESFLIFRNYAIEKIERPKYIEQWVWKYIPFLTYKASIREATLKLIQSNIIGKSKKTL